MPAGQRLGSPSPAGGVPRGRAPLRPVGNGACRRVLPGSCPTPQPRPGAGGMGSVSRVGRTVGFTRFTQGCAYKGWTGKGLNTAGSPGALQKGCRNESVPAPTGLVCCIPHCRVLLQHGAPRDCRPQPESSRQGHRKAFSSWRGKVVLIVISVTACIASGCVYSRRRSKRRGRGEGSAGHPREGRGIAAEQQAAFADARLALSRSRGPRPGQRPRSWLGTALRVAQGRRGFCRGVGQRLPGKLWSRGGVWALPALAGLCIASTALHCGAQVWRGEAGTVPPGLGAVRAASCPAGRDVPVSHTAQPLGTGTDLGHWDVPPLL